MSTLPSVHASHWADASEPDTDGDSLGDTARVAESAASHLLGKDDVEQISAGDCARKYVIPSRRDNYQPSSTKREATLSQTRDVPAATDPTASYDQDPAPLTEEQVAPQAWQGSTPSYALTGPPSNVFSHELALQGIGRVIDGRMRKIHHLGERAYLATEQIIAKGGGFDEMPEEMSADFKGVLSLLKELGSVASGSQTQEPLGLSGSGQQGYFNPGRASEMKPGGTASYPPQ